MKLTRTPGMHHDYNIKLTRAELLGLDRPVRYGDWTTFDQLFDLVEREAEKLDDASRESGKKESGG